MLADVGISKTAFYKHFESKDDLMLAALELKYRWLQDTFREAIQERGGPTAIGQLWALLDVVDQIISSSEYQGCIFVNASIEFPLLHEPTHVAAAQHKRAIEDIVYELAARADADDPRAGPAVLPDHGRRVHHAPAHRRSTDDRRRPPAGGSGHRRPPAPGTIFRRVDPSHHHVRRCCGAGNRPYSGDATCKRVSLSLEQDLLRRDEPGEEVPHQSLKLIVRVPTDALAQEATMKTNPWPVLPVPSGASRDLLKPPPSVPPVPTRGSPSRKALVTTLRVVTV